MKTLEWMRKAEQALTSAQVLLSLADFDGACNRAYYAMFDAARAALLISGSEEQALSAKTHNGLIAAFSLHLVKTGQVPSELGRALNKVEEIRLFSDYSGESIKPDKAAWAVEQAEIFVQTLRKHFFESDSH